MNDRDVRVVLEQLRDLIASVDRAREGGDAHERPVSSIDDGEAAHVTSGVSGCPVESTDRREEKLSATPVATPGPTAVESPGNPAQAAEPPKHPHEHGRCETCYCDAYQDAERAERARAVEIIKALLAHVLWCSGSGDFGPGGNAYVGWQKHEPVREAARRYVGETP